MGVGEPVEMGLETWEVHRFLQGRCSMRDTNGESRKVLRTGLWMAESAVVAMKRVMTVEQRAGR